MPLYDYECRSCGHKSSKLIKLADYEKEQLCGVCSHTLQRIIGAPRVQGDYATYLCPITNKPIEGRVAHRENLKRHGCRVFEAGEKEEMLANKKLREAKEERAVDETVERTIAAMPTKKKEVLFNEVQSGITATVERL